MKKRVDDVDQFLDHMKDEDQENKEMLEKYPTLLDDYNRMSAADKKRFEVWCEELKRQDEIEEAQALKDKKH